MDGFEVVCLDEDEFIIEVEGVHSESAIVEAVEAAADDPFNLHAIRDTSGLILLYDNPQDERPYPGQYI